MVDNRLRLGTIIYSKYGKIIEEFFHSEQYPHCHKKKMDCFRNDDKGLHYKCLICKKIRILPCCYEIYYDSKGVVQIRATYKDKDWEKKTKLTDFFQK
jgi:hypothetical protein